MWAYLIAFLIGVLPAVSHGDIELPSSMGAHCQMPMARAQEGNPGHHEPPPGWHCAHGKGNDKDAPCTCHRECVDHPGSEEDGIVTPPSTTVKEDPKCSAYCYQDHCSCGVNNCD